MDQIWAVLIYVKLILRGRNFKLGSTSNQVVKSQEKIILISQTIVSHTIKVCKEKHRKSIFKL